VVCLAVIPFKAPTRTGLAEAYLETTAPGNEGYVGHLHAQLSPGPGCLQQGGRPEAEPAVRRVGTVPHSARVELRPHRVRSARADVGCWSLWESARP